MKHLCYIFFLFINLGILFGQDYQQAFYASDGCSFVADGMFPIDGELDRYCLYGRKAGIAHWLILDGKRNILSEGSSPIITQFYSGLSVDGTLMFFGSFRQYNSQGYGFTDYNFELYSGEGELISSKLYDEYGPFGSDAWIRRDSSVFVFTARGICTLDWKKEQLLYRWDVNYDPYSAIDADRLGSSCLILTNHALLRFDFQTIDTLVDLDQAIPSGETLLGMMVESEEAIIIRGLKKDYLIENSNGQYSVSSLTIDDDIQLLGRRFIGGENYTLARAKKYSGDTTDFYLIKRGLVQDSFSVFDQHIRYRDRRVFGSLDLMMGNIYSGQKNNNTVIQEFKHLDEKSNRDVAADLELLRKYNRDLDRGSGNIIDMTFVDFRVSATNLGVTDVNNMCIWVYTLDRNGMTLYSRIFSSEEGLEVGESNIIFGGTIPYRSTSRIEEICVQVYNLDSYVDDYPADNIICKGIDELLNEEPDRREVIAYPNPFSSNLKLQWDYGVLDNVEVYNTKGEKVLCPLIYGTNRLTLTGFRDLLPGVYLIKFQINGVEDAVTVLKQ